MIAFFLLSSSFVVVVVEATSRDDSSDDPGQEFKEVTGMVISGVYAVAFVSLFIYLTALCSSDACPGLNVGGLLGGGGDGGLLGGILGGLGGR